MHALTTVILAAGEGKRMRSRQPKVLHELCGRPLISYSLRLARAVGERIVLVVGPDADAVRAVAGDGVAIVEQRERLGTGHAVLQARGHCEGLDGPILVMPSDAPLLSAETIERLVSHHATTGAAATLLTAVVDRPLGYGRVLRQGGRVKRIVEDRDATDDEKRVNEINTSVYCFDGRRLWPALERVRPEDDQGEDYLTDVIGAGCQIRATKLGDRVRLLPYCVMTESVVDNGAVMGPFCHLRPKSHVGENCEIGNFIELKKAKVGRRTKAHHVGYLGDVVIGEGANIGAGTIFVNYDGAAKHTTVVGDGAFVGSNTSIVAPLTIGEGAYVAAGSVITKDVPADALVVERAQQVVKEGWAARRRAARAAQKKKDS